MKSASSASEPKAVATSGPAAPALERRRRGLVSPHGTAGTLDDLGSRARLVARQRIRRARARRRALRRLFRGVKWVGGSVLVVAALVGGIAWLLTTPWLAVRSIQV